MMRLEVPATPDSLRVVRVATAAAAADAIVDVTRLDDVRLAVDEMAVAAMDGAAPTARLCLEVERTTGSLVVRGMVRGARGRPLDGAGTVLLDGTTCRHTLRHHGSTSTFDLTFDLESAPGQRR